MVRRHGQTSHVLRLPWRLAGIARASLRSISVRRYQRRTEECRSLLVYRSCHHESSVCFEDRHRPASYRAAPRSHGTIPVCPWLLHNMSAFREARVVRALRRIRCGWRTRTTRADRLLPDLTRRLAVPIAGENNRIDPTIPLGSQKLWIVVRRN